jgi:two-component system, NarL family, invasion response regulator UvrY
MGMVEEAPVKVLVVDDQAPFRGAAKRVVGMTPGFEVVGEAMTGEEAVEMAGTLKPDLILMDINLPGINGIEAVRRIQAQNPDVIAFLLSTYAEVDLPADARTCGASAYIHKERFMPQLLDALWTAGGDPAWPTAS